MRKIIEKIITYIEEGIEKGEKELLREGVEVKIEGELIERFDYRELLKEIEKSERDIVLREYKKSISINLTKVILKDCEIGDIVDLGGLRGLYVEGGKIKELNIKEEDREKLKLKGVKTEYELREEELDAVLGILTKGKEKGVRKEELSGGEDYREGYNLGVEEGIEEGKKENYVLGVEKGYEEGYKRYKEKCKRKGKGVEGLESNLKGIEKEYENICRENEPLSAGDVINYRLNTSEWSSKYEEGFEVGFEEGLEIGCDKGDSAYEEGYSVGIGLFKDLLERVERRIREEGSVGGIALITDDVVVYEDRVTKQREEEDVIESKESVEGEKLEGVEVKEEGERGYVKKEVNKVKGEGCKEEGGVEYDLKAGGDYSYKDLGGLDLRGLDLRGCNLDCTNLRCVKIDKSTKLEGVSMRYAHLIDAQIEEGALEGVDLRYTVVYNNRV